MKLKLFTLAMFLLHFIGTCVVLRLLAKHCAALGHYDAFHPWLLRGIALASLGMILGLMQCCYEIGKGKDL